MSKKITHDELKRILEYLPEEGVFVWKYRSEFEGKPSHSWNIKFAGKIAGSLKASHGYPIIRINSFPYLCHRLAWFYMTKVWPPHQIDHINGKREDFKFCNLRLATSAQNKMNTEKHKRNTSGYKGVRFHKASGLWQARVMRNRKEMSIGYFETAEKAAIAYAKFVSHIDGDFFRSV